MPAFYAYPYAGPQGIQRASTDAPAGEPIESADALAAWLERNPDAQAEGATYVVDLRGRLKVAPRRSEHVACASGEPVLTAGELTFGAAATIARASNHSTGYCPDVDSFAALEKALRDAGLQPPRAFSPALVFRRCPRCRELNVVKGGWFVCAMCDADLPEEWNVSTRF